MDEELVKVLEKKDCEKRFQRLYGEKPKNKTKALDWETKRLAWTLAWDSCKRFMKVKIEEEIREFFAETDSEYVWLNNKGERFIQQLYLDEYRV